MHLITNRQRMFGRALARSFMAYGRMAGFAPAQNTPQGLPPVLATVKTIRATILLSGIANVGTFVPVWPLSYRIVIT
jgi:hypothetical protein